MNINSARRLLGPVLRDVSRSFYVSMRLLPRRLRDPIRVAYLLARASDTIADTIDIPVSVRAEALRKLAAAIQENGDRSAIADLGQSFAPLQSNAPERKLIEVLPQCLELLDLMNVADRADIRDVLGKINRGQRLDIELLGDPADVNALGTAADLHQYTYDVAGSVGEFWTHLCFRYIAEFAVEPENQMLKLGRKYGDGLQLINILRDAHVDLRNGRSYFPADELAVAGLSPSQILNEPARFEPIYRKWIDEAERGLEAGMKYVGAINHFRVRAATVLPALIGARTLAMLRAAGPKALQERIKVPRKEVRGMIATVALTLAKRQQLDEMFRRNSLTDSPSPQSSP